VSNPEGSVAKQGKTIEDGGNASFSVEPTDAERIILSKKSEERLLKDCEQKINIVL
jgi:hypothetical protein